jgi:hypothetical protein
MGNLKRDYHYGHKTWTEFMFYIGRLPGASKFVLAIELVFMFNFLFVAWPIYWAIKIIERIWPND